MSATSRRLTLTLAMLSACGQPVAHDAGIDAAPDALAQDVRETSTCTVDAHATYPDGPFDYFTGSVLPDLHFTDASGHDVALHDFYAPCVSPAPILAIRTFAAWSSLSRQSASHTSRFRTHPNGGRLRLLDLLVLGQDNIPAAPADLTAWRTRYDVAPDTLATDPAYRFRAGMYGSHQLPTVLFVDTSTMRVVNIVTPITLDPIAYSIDWAVALTDGVTPPRSMPPHLTDGRFTDDQWELIQAMSPLTPPPADRTNAHADDTAAAHLGASLFADASLSPSNTVSCATCHSPTNHFMDARATGMGVAVGDRNTPSVALSSYAHWLFWDGRADSLWAQALGPFENAREMASSRLFIAHAIADRYAAAYVSVFGALPMLSDTVRFPPVGAPGDAAFDAMSASDRDAVNRLFVNVGKSIAAYERTLHATPIALDRYVAGQFDALTPSARDGLLNFVSFGCIQCHYGPRLADDSFHNIGMPTGRTDGQPDRGRIDAIAQLSASPFRADSVFSDARAPSQTFATDAMMLGQFATPPLRGVAVTGPWGHGGTFTRLTDVVVHYGSRTTQPPVHGTIGTLDEHVAGFDTLVPSQYVIPLTEFLQTLDAP